MSMNLLTTFRRLKHDDEGSTLAAVLMVIMVVIAIGAATMQTAQHSNDVSSVDRERLQTVQAAEAGVNESIRALQAGSRTCDGLVTTDGAAGTVLHDGADEVGRFRTRISPTTDANVCLISSWGYAPTGDSRALRHIEVQTTLVPNHGFPYTLFAEGDAGGADAGKAKVKNGGNVQGDIYAEVLDSAWNSFDAENVITPDTIVAKNNAVYTGTLWAGGDVTMGNGGNVGGSVLASGTKAGTQGNIVLNNAVVGLDARAKGTISGSDNVQGTVSANDASVPAPPVLQKPTFGWTAANYPSYIENTAANITTTLNTNKDNLQGVYHATGSTSTLTIPAASRVTGNLTIVADGKIVLPSTLTAVGGPWTVLIIALSSDVKAIDDMNKTFTSDMTNLDVLLFTNGGVNFDKRASFKGSIYASIIEAKNGFDAMRSTTLAALTPPGFGFDPAGAVSYSAVPTLWREVVPGAPPA
jgi:hypothetical protein